ncbi:MAG: 6-bladed beta-propeller [Gammaproteobacteria bacterium]|nr:MAG: 6-bladed beta-propeller [Gammaproteobacteria bacterium]
MVYNQDGKLKQRIGNHGTKPGELINPTGLAIFEKKLYVVDEGNNRIQVFDTDTGRLISVLGSLGKDPGQFTIPKALTIDTQGNLYVSDNLHRIQKFDASGLFIKQWGRYGGMPGEMADPIDVSFSNDTIYVADLVNHRLQAFDTNGDFKLTWGRHPEKMHEGMGRTHYPAYMKASPDGKIIAVCEPFEYRCQIFETAEIFNMKPVNVLAWWQKFPKFHYGGGARMARVKDVNKVMNAVKILSDETSLDKKKQTNEAPVDILFITEPDIHRVVAFNVDSDANKMTARWSVGAFGDGPLRWQMLSAKSVSISRGSIFVGDAGNHNFQEIDLLTGEYKGTHFGPGTGPGQFNGPTDLAEAPNGDLYIGDYHNNRIQVFDKNLKFKFEFGKLGDGEGELFSPMGPTFDPKYERLYVSDTGNLRISVFDAKGNFLFTFGRRARPGEWGNGTFLQPFDVAVSPTGEVYVTDPALQLVQKFSSDGKFIKQWGGWGTKPGQFYKCKGIDIGSDGKVYVIDFGNHRGQVFDSDGNFLAIFGEGILFPKDSLNAEGEPKNPIH